MESLTGRLLIMKIVSHISIDLSKGRDSTDGIYGAFCGFEKKSLDRLAPGNYNCR